MKRFALVSALFLFAFSVKAQNDSQDQKSYALLDLGFNAKMLNLSLCNPLLVPKEEEVVKKSPRSLSDILGKSKSSSKKASAAEYHLVAGCFSNFKNAERLVAQLKKEGYKASLIGKSNNLHLVSFTSFNSYDAAQVGLSELDSKGIDSWIRKY
jgi:cell division protein FtsN